MVSCKPVGLQRRAQRADAAVHHVGGREDVAAGRGLHQALLDQPLDGGVVEDAAALDHAVVAVLGERIERHVAHHAHLGRGVLHRPDRPADQAVGIGRRRARRRPSSSPSMCGKMAMAGMPSALASLRRLGRLGDRPALDARHGGHRDAALALVHHHRPDQVGGRQRRLAHQPPDPVGLAQAAQAQGGVGGERRLWLIARRSIGRKPAKANDRAERAALEAWRQGRERQMQRGRRRP